MVEAAFTLPLFLLIVFSTLELGWVVYNKIALQFALNQTARWAITEHRSPGEILQHLQTSGETFGVKMEPSAPLSSGGVALPESNSTQAPGTYPNPAMMSTIPNIPQATVTICGNDNIEECKSSNGVTEEFLPGATQVMAIKAKLGVPLILSNFTIDVSASAIVKNEPYFAK
jgi:hypothetical protein